VRKAETTIFKKSPQRDIGAELLAAVREMKAGRWARRTVFETQKDGTVSRRIERSDGTVEKDEVLTGAHWELMSARAQSGMSQAEFAKTMGVSRRTLENWEQGRVQPSGAARRLLQLAARYPDTVQRLAHI
jgi:putative transcriptional regulator